MTLLLWWAVAAQADVVRGPMPCPSGAIGRTSHSGPWCAPHLCPQSGCPEDRVCETTGQCVVETEVPCGGRRREPCTDQRRVHHGPCETDADCSQGSCVVADYCVEPPPDATPPPPPEGGGSLACGCSSIGTAGGVFLLGLLPLVAVRARRSATGPARPPR